MKHKSIIAFFLFLLASALGSCTLLVSTSGAHPEGEIKILEEFSFESQYIEVYGSKMHYVDEGHGDPILFIHGNPSSSYIWRNIIPHVTDQGRAIAVDLIGMGKSDKPDINYTFEDHQRYLEEFIETLGLENITLVIHDWGSALGLDYAARHPENIVGIVMMEALLPPTYPFPDPPAEGSGWATFKDPVKARKLIIEENMVVRSVPHLVIRELSETELDHYNEPFKDPDSRRVLFAWAMELPFGGVPEYTHQVILDYTVWLEETAMPFLFLYGEPGTIAAAPIILWLEENVDNIEIYNIGPARHFMQEDRPHEIGLQIADWRKQF